VFSMAYERGQPMEASVSCLIMELLYPANRSGTKQCEFQSLDGLLYDFDIERQQWIGYDTCPKVRTAY
jgi:hypothetical protein